MTLPFLLVFLLLYFLLMIIDDLPQGLSVYCLYSCMNIIFHVDGGIVFEVSFLEAYDCWAVFSNK